MAKETGVSLNPADAVEGGGLLDDVDVELQSHVFRMWDYGGKVAQAVPALCVKMVTEEGQEVEQYFSAGNPTDWVPSEDGKRLLAIGNAKGLNSTSNTMLYLTSLVNAGYPQDKIGDDITIFDGIKAHINRVPAPKRPGIAKKEGEREAMVTIVTAIHELPGEKGKKTTAAKPAAGKGKPAPAAEAEGDSAEDTATNALIELLAEQGEVAKQKLPAILFAKFKADPNRNEILKLATSDEFLSNGPWTYEGGVLSMG